MFQGTVIRNEGTNPAADLANPYREDICVGVYGDGRLLYRSQSVNLSGNEIQKFSVDVSGVNTLRITINGKNYIRLCSAVLTAAGGDSGEEGSERENELIFDTWLHTSSERGEPVFYFFSMEGNGTACAESGGCTGKFPGRFETE